MYPKKTQEDINKAISSLVKELRNDQTGLFFRVRIGLELWDGSNKEGQIPIQVLLVNARNVMTRARLDALKAGNPTRHIEGQSQVSHSSRIF